MKVAVSPRVPFPAAKKGASRGGLHARALFGVDEADEGGGFARSGCFLWINLSEISRS